MNDDDLSREIAVGVARGITIFIWQVTLSVIVIAVVLFFLLIWLGSMA